MQIKLFDKIVGDGQPVFVIAEVGLNHNGSMEIAKQLIDAAKAAGCDAVKFQKRHVPSLAVRSFLDAPDLRFPAFGSTYREVRQAVEFSTSQLMELRDYSRSKAIPFFVTPFELNSAKEIDALEPEVIKSASHILTFIPLLEVLAQKRKPLIVSTGMSTIEELDMAVSVIRKYDCPFALLHCVSAYPTPFSLVQLRMIDLLRERYGVPVGYSGHEEFSAKSLPTLAAVARGACIVERHITLDNNMPGFDHKISLNPADLKEVVLQIRSIESMMGDGKKHLLPEELVKREQQRVSIATARAIRAGEIISSEMISFRGPGTGFATYEINNVVGKKAVVDISEDVLIEKAMLS